MEEGAMSDIIPIGLCFDYNHDARCIVHGIVVDKHNAPFVTYESDWGNKQHMATMSSTSGRPCNDVKVT